jgi:GAF domain-containing protein
MPELQLDLEWSNRGQTREERMTRVAAKLRMYLDGEEMTAEAVSLLGHALERLGLDIADPPALRQALKEVKSDAKAAAEEGHDSCGPDLDDAQLLRCEQRRYAAMYSDCGLACVRAFTRFIEPDLRVAGYAQGWPLTGARAHRHRHQRAAHGRGRDRV